MTDLRDYLFHEEPGATLYCGDCREVLPLLAWAGPPTQRAGGQCKEVTPQYKNVIPAASPLTRRFGDLNTTRSLRDLIAGAIANARAMRRGAPPISNVLDIVPQRIKDDLYDDADRVIAVLNDAHEPAPPESPA